MEANKKLQLAQNLVEKCNEITGLGDLTIDTNCANHLFDLGIIENRDTDIFYGSKHLIQQNLDYMLKRNIPFNNRQIDTSTDVEKFKRFAIVNKPEKIAVLNTEEKRRQRKRKELLNSVEFKQNTINTDGLDIPYYSTREETVSGNCCCQAPIPGCMDPTACNHNLLATVPCGSQVNEMGCGSCGVPDSWMPCKYECQQEWLAGCADDGFNGCPACGDCCQNVSDIYPEANGISGHCAQYDAACCDCNGDCNGGGSDGLGCEVDCNGDCKGTAVEDCAGNCCEGNTGEQCYGVDLCGACLPINDNDFVTTTADCIGSTHACCGCVDQYCETGSGSYWICDNSTLSPHPDFPDWNVCTDNSEGNLAPRIDGGCTVCGTNQGQQM